MVEGIVIADYRSIGEAQHIAPLGKINLFVGGNNSGKSNILRFVNENLLQLYHTARRGNSSISSTPHLQRGRPTSAQLLLKTSIDDLVKELNGDNPRVKPLIYKLHQSMTNDGAFWIGDGWLSPGLIQSARHYLNQDEWYRVWTTATTQTGGGVI